MLPDGAKSNEFFDGIDDFPKRDRFNQSEGAFDTDVQEDFIEKAKEVAKRLRSKEPAWEEEEEECPQCVGDRERRERNSREFIHDADEVFEKFDDEIHHAHKRLKAPLKRAVVRRKKVYGKDGVERTYIASFTYAYSNVLGNERKVTQNEYATADSIEYGKVIIHDRLVNNYPNCTVLSIQHKEEK